MCQLFSRDHRNVARDGWKALEPAEFQSHELQEVVRQINFRDEDRRCARRLAGGKLTGETDQVLLNANVRRQREVWVLGTLHFDFPKMQRFECPLEIKQIQLARSAAMPVRLALRVAAEQERDPTDFLFVRRKEDATELKQSHTLCAGPDVSLER